MGSECVTALVRRGANVVAVDIDGPGLDRLQASLGGDASRLHTVVADVGDEMAMTGAVADGEAAFGGLAGLFNIAGTEGTLAWLHEMEAEEFDHTLRVNTDSVFITVSLVLPRLVARGGGRIVNTGSYVAVRATRGTSAYGTAKHAVVGLTRSVALEYARQGIQANVVCPGAMNTPMVRSMFKRLAPEAPARGEKIIRDLTPTGALVEPRELADTGSWLLLDAPDQITGQVFMVDGGRTAG